MAMLIDVAPKLGTFGQTSAPLRPHSSRTRPSSGDFYRIRPDVGKHRPEFQEFARGLRAPERELGEIVYTSLSAPAFMRLMCALFVQLVSLASPHASSHA